MDGAKRDLGKQAAEQARILAESYLKTANVAQLADAALWKQVALDRGYQFAPSKHFGVDRGREAWPLQFLPPLPANPNLLSIAFRDNTAKYLVERVEEVLAFTKHAGITALHVFVPPDTDLNLGALSLFGWPTLRLVKVEADSAASLFDGRAEAYPWVRFHGRAYPKDIARCLPMLDSGVLPSSHFRHIKKIDLKRPDSMNADVWADILRYGGEAFELCADHLDIVATRQLAKFLGGGACSLSSLKLQFCKHDAACLKSLTDDLLVGLAQNTTVTDLTLCGQDWPTDVLNALFSLPVLCAVTIRTCYVATRSAHFPYMASLLAATRFPGASLFKIHISFPQQPSLQPSAEEVLFLATSVRLGGQILEVFTNGRPPLPLRVAYNKNRQLLSSWMRVAFCLAGMRANRNSVLRACFPPLFNLLPL